MQVQPYLFFNGRCEEAVEFYRAALGAQVTMLMRYSESPDPGMCPSSDPAALSKIMHASFRIGDSLVMASDDPSGQTKGFEGFSLSINATDTAEADRLFAALGAGGQVIMPLDETFFAARFGMIQDRFGVAWMILVSK